MRVAVFCPYSLSRPGGVQGQATGLARAFAARGHDTVVFAPTDGAVAIEGLAHDVVSLGRSVSLPANGSLAPVSLSPVGLRRAVKVLREGGFDVAHFHEPLAPGPGYGCLVAGHVPKVGTFHRAGSSAAYRLLGPAARWAAGHLQVRCAVSLEAQRTAAGAVGGTYELMGNGVDLARFADAVLVDSDGPIVVFVGRHEERKGLADLLEAFTSVRTQVPGTLWVVGEGPETKRLMGRYPPDARLVWLGALDDAEVASRLLGAHVLCAPSRRGESFGVVLLEAMAARCAVVATDLAGYAAVVGGHGLLVPPGDTAALAGALHRALSDAALGSGLCGPEALEAAATHAGQWSMDALAGRYIEIFDTLTGPSLLS